MEIFKGDKLLENRTFEALFWGQYLKSTAKICSPFLFVYNESKKIKTLIFEDSEDDLSRAIELINKIEEPFDQFILGYETMIQLDSTGPKNIIAVKSFDVREKEGLFFGVVFQLDENENFNKIGNFKFIDKIMNPLFKELDRLPTKFSQSVINSTHEVQGDTFILKINIAHENEVEIGTKINAAILHLLNKNEIQCQTCIFEIKIEEREFDLDFFKYILLENLYKVLISDVVVQKFTHNQKIFKIIASMGDDRILFEDSNMEAVTQLKELFQLMNPSQGKNEKGKPWWKKW
ncbi:MAG: hypothetical protein HYR91_01185 [Flavobacteriia bacterium]|nr:hypothetical protein [Flavobacteriia bacterium]